MIIFHRIGKVFTDRGYIKQTFIENLFGRGIQPVYGLSVDMKNRLISMWNKNHTPQKEYHRMHKNLITTKANIVHLRHCSIRNFIMNICIMLTAYSFFENKPKALTYAFGKNMYNCHFLRLDYLKLT